MKQIPLFGERGRGLFMLVDDQDYERLVVFHWHVQFTRHAVYAMGFINKKHVLAHRFILNAPKGTEVDHINGNGLDNQRANLAIGNQQRNQLNRHYKTPGCSSKYIGVSWHKAEGRWRARIKFNGVEKHLGSYATEGEAASAKG